MKPSTGFVEVLIENKGEIPAPAKIYFLSIGYIFTQATRRRKKVPISDVSDYSAHSWFRLWNNSSEFEGANIATTSSSMTNGLTAG